MIRNTSMKLYKWARILRLALLLAVNLYLLSSTEPSFTALVAMAAAWEHGEDLHRILTGKA